MSCELEESKHFNTAEIEIFGTGNIGDKARQLLEKTPFLNEIGFRTPRRVVLAEDFFDGFFQRNGLGSTLREVEASEGSIERIKRGSLTREEFEAIEKIAFSFGDNPLAIRSSAEKDARGTGIYKSFFTESRINNVRKAVREVLASYFSESALAFRKDAQAGEGFGVIIEPLIGQSIDCFAFAPLLSGFGYTSTSRGEGYIAIVQGFGGGVETRDALRVTKSGLEDSRGYLFVYVKRKMLEGFEGRSSLFTQVAFPNYWQGIAFYQLEGGFGECTRSLSEELTETSERLNLFPFFKKIRATEERFGEPQYFEWAMTIEKGRSVYWLVQIADVNQNLDLLDFGDIDKRVIATGHSVTGTGIKECSKIFLCLTSPDIESLADFNSENKEYILIFSDSMTAGYRQDKLGERLRYKDFSNASALLEIPFAAHVGDSIGHLGGQVALTGKVFGILDSADLAKRIYQEITGNREYQDREYKKGEQLIQPGRFKVVASERQDRIVVYFCG